VSNPCFETWLYLHHGDLGYEYISSTDMKKKLVSLLGGYNSSRLDLSQFKDVDTAITRAKALDRSPEERWPTKTGTHVYKIVEKIM